MQQKPVAFLILQVTNPLTFGEKKCCLPGKQPPAKILSNVEVGPSLTSADNKKRMCTLQRDGEGHFRFTTWG